MNADSNKAAGSVTRNLIAMLSAWVNRGNKSFIFDRHEGVWPACDCNKTPAWRLQLGASEKTELNQKGAEALKTRSVYLPTTMEDLSGDVYRVVFMVENTKTNTDGIYQIVLEKQHLTTEKTEWLFDQVRNFLAYEVLFDQPLHTAQGNPTSVADFVKASESILILKSYTLSDNVKLEFPLLEQELRSFLQYVRGYLTQSKSSVLQSLPSREELLFTGQFLRGYLYRSHIDVVTEVAEIYNAINVIVHKIRNM